MRMKSSSGIPGPRGSILPIFLLCGLIFSPRVHALLDDDGDGMSDIWEAEYDLEYENDDGPSGHADGDGYTNLQEAKGMTDPTSSAYSERPDFHPSYDPYYSSDGKITTLYFRWYDKPDVRYLVQGKSISSGAWSGLFYAIGNGGTYQPYTKTDYGVYSDYRLSFYPPIDSDSDGLGNDEEALFGSSKYNADADGDDLEDADEFRYGGNPNDADSDNDGLDDFAEAMIWGSSLTDPNDPLDPAIDKDGDDVSDVWEWYWHAQNFDSSADPDSDGYSNLRESEGGTNPFSASISERPDFIPGSGPEIYNDGKQVQLRFKWYDKRGVSYRLEGKTSSGDWALLGTRTGDGMGLITRTISGNQIYSHYRLVFVPIDYDGDNLTDHEEFLLGTIRFDADSDNDGLDDDEEFYFGGNPLLADGDGDGISDYDEVFVHDTDPSGYDWDGDLFHKLVEAFAGTSSDTFQSSAAANGWSENTTLNAQLPSGWDLLLVIPDGSYISVETEDLTISGP